MSRYSPDEIKDEAITAFQTICDIHHPRLLKGQAFELIVSQGSHRYYTEGTFVSSAWSDEQGWQFFIDVPEYCGRKIRYLTWDDHQWFLRLEESSSIPDIIGYYIENQLDETELKQRVNALRFIPVTSIDFKGL